MRQEQYPTNDPENGPWSWRTKPVADPGLAKIIPSPKDLASFRHAPFGESAWMNALYDENFPALNQHRINALSYLFGMYNYIAQVNQHIDSGCPEPFPETVNVYALKYNPAMISGQAAQNGREYSKDDVGMLTSAWDNMGIGNLGSGQGVTEGVFTAQFGRAERSGIVAAGSEDAKYLLAHYGGCAGAIFKRVYVGMNRFALREPQEFSIATKNAKVVLNELKIEVSGWYDRRPHVEEIDGQPPIEFDVTVSEKSNLTELAHELSKRSLQDEHIPFRVFAGDGTPIVEGKISPENFKGKIMWYQDISLRYPSDRYPNEIYMSIYDPKTGTLYRSSPVALSKAIIKP